MSLCTYNKNKLFNLQLIIVLLKYVFMRQREEKEHSAAGVVTGNVRYSLKSLSTSWCMPLYVSLTFIVLTIVRTLVTFFIVLKELVLIMSGSIDSCIFSLSRSKPSFKYISKSVEMHFFDDGASPHTYETPKDRHRHMYFEVTELTAGEVERWFIQNKLGMTLNQLLLNLPMVIQTFWVFSFDGEGLVLLLDLHNHGLLQYIKKKHLFSFLRERK